MICYLGFGSNLGERLLNLGRAEEYLRQNPQITIIGKSSIQETKPWGNELQPDFLNYVIQIETDLNAKALLEVILEIEQKLGRTREIKWGPRLIDIDILFYGQEIIRDDYLTIPHPYLLQREFIMAALLEIAPNWIHPEYGKSIRALSGDKHE